MRTLAVFLVAFTLLPAVSFSKGFDESYQVFRGNFDANVDTATDLYVRKAPEIVLIHGDIITPIVIQSDVTEFVLRQEADKTFSIVSDLTASQKSSMSQWPEAAVEIVLGDLNVDGFLDLVLRGVDNVVTGADDQIVYAPGTPGSAPAFNRAIDADFRKFFEEVSEWMKNPDYFEENADPIMEVRTVTESFWVIEWCGLQPPPEAEVEIQRSRPVRRNSRPDPAWEIANMHARCRAHFSDGEGYEWYYN